jgi:hypothetical protein
MLTKDMQRLCVRLLGLAIGLQCCTSCSKTADCDCTQSSNGPAQSVPNIHDPLLDRKPVAWSIIQLIAYPERFQHSRVYVGGFLAKKEMASEISHGELYLNKESAITRLTNYVDVYFGPCMYTTTNEKIITLEDAVLDFDSDVEIHGEFEATANGEGDPKFGTICNITTIGSERRSRLKRARARQGIQHNGSMKSPESR